MIETERLILRLFEDGDLEDVCEYCLDMEQMHYIPESFSNKHDVKDYMNKHKDTLFLVELKEEKKIIGHLSFYPFFESHSYEIGWVFNKKYTKKKYAYEASKALMDYGFKHKEIHRIIATAQPENEASWRLMEKLKMRREAHFKQCIPCNDGWWDEYYYAILESEWTCE